MVIIIGNNAPWWYNPKWIINKYLYRSNHYIYIDLTHSSIELEWSTKCGIKNGNITMARARRLRAAGYSARTWYGSVYIYIELLFVIHDWCSIIICCAGRVGWGLKVVKVIDGNSTHDTHNEIFIFLYGRLCWKLVKFEAYFYCGYRAPASSYLACAFEYLVSSWVNWISSVELYRITVSIFHVTHTHSYLCS